jgi:putative flippase GtrA
MIPFRQQLVRFGVVGLVNTGIGLALIYAAMYFFKAGPALANAIGYGIGLAVSFTLNRFWTFGDDRHASKVLPSYVLAAALAYLCNLGTVLLGTRAFHANPYLMQLAGVAVYTGSMFVLCRWFVFAPTAGSGIR